MARNHAKVRRRTQQHAHETPCEDEVASIQVATTTLAQPEHSKWKQIDQTQTRLLNLQLAPGSVTQNYENALALGGSQCLHDMERARNVPQWARARKHLREPFAKFRFSSSVTRF